RHPAAELLAVECGRSEDEEVDLEHGLEMDGVEAPMFADRLAHLVAAHVEVALQTGSKRFDLVRAKLYDEIRVTGASRLAIGRTRERASNHVGNVQLVKNPYDSPE